MHFSAYYAQNYASTIIRCQFLSQYFSICHSSYVDLANVHAHCPAETSILSEVNSLLNILKV